MAARTLPAILDLQEFSYLFQRQPEALSAFDEAQAVGHVLVVLAITGRRPFRYGQ
jgi:hypothetical protein